MRSPEEDSRRAGALPGRGAKWRGRIGGGRVWDVAVSRTSILRIHDGGRRGSCETETKLQSMANR